MYARDKKQDNTSSVKNSKSKETAIQFKDLRSEGEHQNAISSSVAQSPRVTAQRKKMDSLQKPIQKKENKTGLPDQLKSGIESLSGMDMSDTRVHYNSSKPAQLQAHAYAQGNQIHVAPGQEKHVAHEAWHVVQQKQGRVQPTMQMKGKVNINDDAGLEREADVMGAKALQMKESDSIVSYKISNQKSDIVQGQFEEDLKNGNLTYIMRQLKREGYNVNYSDVRKASTSPSIYNTIEDLKELFKHKKKPK